jgi:AhpD family alkylhydroperoxidase
VFAAYGDLSKTVCTDRAPASRTKDLIVLAVAVTRQCDGCIASHAQGPAGRGATDEEVAGALGVAVLVNGGPWTVHAPVPTPPSRSSAGCDRSRPGRG